ncbi:MAG TPA: toll/interleukin-1 receptor domain-containing protein, partial [Kofleriaceae bacterium]
MIFVSYAKKDTSVASSVLSRMAAEDLEVFDWQGERRGDDFIDKIEGKIREATSFVALMSPNFLASTWCRRERNLALIRDNDARRRTGAPFLQILKISDVPQADAGFLQPYDWFDMGRLDDLVTALR